METYFRPVRVSNFEDEFVPSLTRMGESCSTSEMDNEIAKEITYGMV